MITVNGQRYFDQTDLARELETTSSNFYWLQKAWKLPKPAVTPEGWKRQFYTEVERAEIVRFVKRRRRIAQEIEKMRTYPGK